MGVSSVFFQYCERGGGHDSQYSTEKGRYFFIVTAKGPKWPLLFEPRFAIQAVTVKQFQGAVMVRVNRVKSVLLFCIKHYYQIDQHNFRIFQVKFNEMSYVLMRVLILKTNILLLHKLFPCSGAYCNYFWERGSVGLFQVYKETREV